MSGPRIGVLRTMTRAVPLLGLLLLTACDYSMTLQRKYPTYAPSDLWTDGASARPLPEGVVAQGDLARRSAGASPPPVTQALLERGRERLRPAMGSPGMPTA